MNAAGLIFSNIHDTTIPELTRTRTMASVPFGCRYRLVDFALSNLVNAGITKVGIITHNNYKSLLEHLGSGRDWDLEREFGGIKILPPHITSYENTTRGQVYSSRLEALIAVTSFISECGEENIVLSDCDVICNIDLADVLDMHSRRGADFTIVTKRVSPAVRYLTPRATVILTDGDGRINDLAEYTSEDSKKAEIEVSMNIMVARKYYLLKLIEDAVAHGHISFEHDIIGRRLGEDKFIAYRHEGYYAPVNSLESYYRCSLDLLDPSVRRRLFGIPDRPVMTRHKNLPPTKYMTGSRVVNSLVADGCVIEGLVENSIVFGSVKVGRGAEVRNCVLMGDTYVGEGAELYCVVTDRNVIIREGRRLSGHETLPFFIGKGVSV
ncbi:MAG: glucose-1-phosphate adenylyltransferase subunit GlgD [Clostridiales bacterium]|nr:glucose-1-phosphate adenylyltransferase subunit GlgD [Clostridiales bacterium]HOA84538.1 glucose-1-phosphate adenylyltransferase subunit GlgD [Bacillota bacterium]